MILYFYEVLHSFGEAGMCNILSRQAFIYWSLRIFTCNFISVDRISIKQS